MHQSWQGCQEIPGVEGGAFLRAIEAALRVAAVPVPGTRAEARDLSRSSRPPGGTTPSPSPPPAYPAAPPPAPTLESRRSGAARCVPDVTNENRTSHQCSLRQTAPRSQWQSAGASRPRPIATAGRCAREKGRSGRRGGAARAAFSIPHATEALVGSILLHCFGSQPRGPCIARMSLSNKLTLDKLDVKGKRVVMR